MDKSCALFRAANLQILDYPFDAALASALDLCNEAVVVVGPSEDNTTEMVRDLAAAYPGRVRVSAQEFVYDRGWQERWWNYAASLTDAEWLVYHDADEVRHEDDIRGIRELMAREDVWLISQPYLHFYMTPRFTKRGYKRNTRIGRRSAGYRMRNWCTDENPDYPACQMVIGEGTQVEAHGYRGKEQAVIGAPVYHYGWCRDALALAMSQAKHKDWYADGKRYADGDLPRVRPWDFVGEFGRGIASGWVRPYDGRHPALIQDWFTAHETQWSKLEEQCLTPA